MNHYSKKGARFSRFSTAPKSKVLLEMNTLIEEPPEVSSDEQPESTGSFHRQIATAIIQHHKYVDRARRSLLPVSPASYTSSMELTPYNNPTTSASPTSSVEYYKGKPGGESSFSLTTSTELLKVLNRIWRLEEQHAASKSLVKNLKSELVKAQMRIQELVREKRMDHQVMDDLMSQIDEERKFRNRSDETLHRKLVKERRTRVLLEELCDEFAEGVREYEKRLRCLKHGTDHIEQVGDGLLLHISEAWLDARMNMVQMKQGVGENGMIMDEIESFLKARRKSSCCKGNNGLLMKVDSGGGGGGGLESFHFDESMMASTSINPPNVEDEDEDDDVHCFELSKNLVGEFSTGTLHEESVGESEHRRPKDCKGSLDDARYEEGQAELNGLTGGVEVTGLESPVELKWLGKTMLRDNFKQHSIGGMELVEGLDGPDKHEWERKMVPRDVGDQPECSWRWSGGSGSKEYTLKDKLLEARLEGRSSRYKCC